ncbi:uncharacterized protein Ecym_4283 [Eremothecium cymbalariae DBVPG|uniref:Uncharacterized protein n=1 Tax=Eremothecium cymbalariae (strain CBS 270.75 / DBVPG 7215 / KCTC 17166 / NRRL Y-17582) TaxID=931890 RepID=G8JTJ3_ERECY|nr:hypothetical protein Ecym_4283 [Eremothecium cymbalariae DBVPG\
MIPLAYIASQQRNALLHVQLQQQKQQQGQESTNRHSVMDQRVPTVEIDKKYWHQQLNLLQHLLRVNNDEQWLFNSVKVRQDVLKTCNNQRWAYFGMEKFKCLFQLNQMLKGIKLDDKQLYKINEKVSFLLYEAHSQAHPYLLDGKTITTTMLSVFICICELIICFDPKTEVHVALCRCIVNGISSQFLRPYIRELWNAVRES